MLRSTIFISRGNESELSERLKKEALERLLGDTNYSLYTDARGKPYVKCSTPVGISVTHSSGVVAVGVFPFEPVGIDMEKMSDTYPARVADRFFSSSERELIVTPRNFYEVWCRKEAYVKMTGEGLKAISSFDSGHTDVFFTDLSKTVSDVLGEEFVFVVASDSPLDRVDVVLV